MDPPTEYCYHYTEKRNLESIFLAGAITAGRDGRVYLSTTRYRSAERAMRDLAIANKHIDCYIQLPLALIPQRSPGSLVGQLRDPDTDLLLREGGGWEVTVEGDVTLPVRAFEIPPG